MAGAGTGHAGSDGLPVARLAALRRLGPGGAARRRGPGRWEPGHAAALAGGEILGRLRRLLAGRTAGAIWRRAGPARSTSPGLAGGRAGGNRRLGRYRPHRDDAVARRRRAGFLRRADGHGRSRENSPRPISTSATQQRDATEASSGGRKSSPFTGRCVSRSPGTPRRAASPPRRPWLSRGNGSGSSAVSAPRCQGPRSTKACWRSPKPAPCARIACGPATGWLRSNSGSGSARPIAR